VLAIYFVALGVFSHLTAGVEADAVSKSGGYTNYLQAKAKLGILQEREVLRSAALDCWDAVAQTMPTGLTLDTMNFSDLNGSRLNLTGTAPSDQVLAVGEFYEKLRKWETRDGKPLFGLNEGGVPTTSLNPGGATVRWSFDLDLKEQPKR
jgi:hypothetical protein